MKTRSLVLVAMALPLGLHAATISLPGASVTANNPNPAIAPTVAFNLANLANGQVDITNYGSSTGSNWTARARGGTHVGLALNAADLTLTTQTAITPTAINFNTNTVSTGLVGNILGNNTILGNILGANLASTWEASVNLTQLGLNLQPSTQYALTFNLAQSTSLLGNLSPAVLSNFNVSVGDSNGFLGAQLLGITDIVASSGTATFTFTTDAVLTGDVVARFGASALLDTDLLGDVVGTPNSTLYSLSNFNVNAVPEPSTLAISGLLVGSLALRRRRA